MVRLLAATLASVDCRCQQSLSVALRNSRTWTSIGWEERCKYIVNIWDLTPSVGVIQLIQTVTAVDPDEPLGGQHFYYSLAPEAANNPNFTLRDNQGRLNTCTAPHWSAWSCFTNLYRSRNPFRLKVDPSCVIMALLCSINRSSVFSLWKRTPSISRNYGSFSSICSGRINCNP